MQCKQELVAYKRLSNGDESHNFVRYRSSVRSGSEPCPTTFALPTSSPLTRRFTPPIFSTLLSDPLALVPFALAAANGVVDGWPIRQLVAAGVGALRGSAPLVRSLSGKRAAILLPPGPLVFTALAASDGRSALLLNPLTPVDEDVLADANVGAVFTTDALQRLLPRGVPRVLMDGAPRGAHFVDVERAVALDLSLHDGLALEGDPDAPGSNEEVLLVPSGDTGDQWTASTHRALLTCARASIAAAGLLASDNVLGLRDAIDADTFAAGEVAALLASARVTTSDPRDVGRACDRIDQLAITAVVARASTFEAMAVALEQRGTALEAPTLRRLVCVGSQITDAVRARWAAAARLDLPWITAPEV